MSYEKISVNYFLVIISREEKQWQWTLGHSDTRTLGHSDTRRRVYWFDAARVIAILLVVFTHVHERLGVSHYLLKSIFYYVDRLGVPIFFMLSGALILPKLANSDLCKTLNFYKLKIPRFIILIFLYSVVTSSIFKIINGSSIIDSLSQSFILYNGIYEKANNGNAYQLWFMYTIIQLYLVAPFLAKLLDRLENKEILLFLIISISFTQVKETLKLIGYPIDFLNRLGVDFLGSYLNYFILGYLIIHRNVRIKLSVSILLILVPLFLCLSQELKEGKFINGLHWYSTSLWILLPSIGIINIIRHIYENKKENRFVTKVSSYSFGIYLIHMIPIYIINHILLSYNINIFVKYFVLFFLVLGFCYIVIFILSKSKWGRYLVL